MKNIILDTDIGPDCDDAGALALLNIYADMGLCRILGVGHCTSNPYGAGTIDAICRKYGRNDVEIGTWTGPEFLNEDYCRRYNGPITQQLENRFRDTQPDDVVKVYRRILAAQPDRSVEFIAIGPLNNLSALLDSPPDERSGLTGRELVQKKVSKLTMMAGIFRPSDPERAAAAEKGCGKRIEDFAEYNVVCDARASKNISDNWPTPKSYLGWEAGLMVTGACLAKKTADDPVRMAYELWNNGKKISRCSWDPMTVVYALLGDCEYVKNSVPGHVRFTEDGMTVFTPDENGPDHFAELNVADEKIVEYIDGLLERY